MITNKKILMLEHDEDDRLIASIFFKQGNHNPEINFVENKNDFFEVLENCKKGTDQYPALIVLNMNAIPVNAAGVLTELKSVPEFFPIPVVVLSGNRNTAKIKECYSLGAASVIIKPDNEKETEKKIGNFLNYWFDTVELL